MSLLIGEQGSPRPKFEPCLQHQTHGSFHALSLDEKRWEAIQAGAISESQLLKILNNADIDEVRQYATPRTTSTLSPAKISKIEAMQASGNYSIAEIAQAVGVSSSTVSKYLK